jgi:UDP-N-acetylglucosamine pyrophosphorylase
MNRFSKIQETLKEFDQSHLLTFWDKLSKSQQNQLLDDIEKANLVEISLAVEKLTSSDHPKRESIEPVPYEVLENIPEIKLNGYEQKGMELIEKGKVAAVLLAGGQGTRLGHDGPKGTYDIGLPGHESLFELQAKRLLLLYKQTGNMIPWYIMTSPINDEETKDFFFQHNYFGYNPELITFFVQPTAPTLTPDGKLMLKTKSSLSLSPNGNGGVFSAMSLSGAIGDMENRGVKWIFMYNVDNAIIKIADPVFVGFADEKDSPIASKSVPKRNPQEKVGIFCLMDGKPSVIEYSEMTKEESEHPEMQNAHISIHLFKLDFVKEIAGKPLPYHFAYKSIPTVDDSGKEIKPTEPNGYKLEQFYFDLFPEAESIAVLQVPREKEFAPVKNKSGEDSPETARAMIILNE